MKCPNCKRSIDLPNNAYLNVETYHPHFALVKSNCCGMGFLLKRELSFKITPYTGDKTEDDWGQTITQQEPNAKSK